MFTTTGARRDLRAAHRIPRILAVGLASALALSACGGSSSAAPTNGPDSSLAPGASSTPGSSSPLGTGGGNGNGAFGAATTALAALDSYAFHVEIQSTSTVGSVTTASHQLYTGIVENKPDKASTFQQSELDANGNVTSGTGIITIVDKAWISSGGSDGPWTEVPAAQADIFVQSMASFRPEQMFGLYFAGLGGDFASAGSESKNGVACTHYTGDENVGTLLGGIAGFQGTWSSDVWIADEGGYLVHSEAAATSATGAEGGSFRIVVDITSPNSAGPVQSPPPA
jgi:hypothetical protein